MRTRVSVIVPARNKENHIAVAMQSISDAVAVDGNAELIIVDHQSTDSTGDRLRQMGLAKHMLSLEGGTIARARNFGAQHATGEYLLFLDCDVTVATDYISRVRHAFAQSGASATGAQVSLPDSPSWVELTWHRLTVDVRSGDRHFINSANFAVKKDVFERLGGFPEEMRTAEDWEICRRIRSASHRIYQDAALVAKHLDNPKTVRAFYRKERWYGLDMLRASEKGEINRTSAATLWFAFCVITSCVGLVLTRPRIAYAGALGVALLLFASLLFRRRATGHWANPVAAMFLLLVFFSARVDGLVRSTFQRAFRS